MVPVSTKWRLARYAIVVLAGSVLSAVPDQPESFGYVAGQFGLAVANFAVLTVLAALLQIYLARKGRDGWILGARITAVIGTIGFAALYLVAVRFSPATAPHPVGTAPLTGAALWIYLAGSVITLGLGALVTLIAGPRRPAVRPAAPPAGYPPASWTQAPPPARPSYPQLYTYSQPPPGQAVTAGQVTDVAKEAGRRPHAGFNGNDLLAWAAFAGLIYSAFGAGTNMLIHVVAITVAVVCAVIVRLADRRARLGKGK